MSEVGQAVTQDVLTFVRASRMRDWSRDIRRSGHTLALVPTMGALHDGHRALLRTAAGRADVVAASIFVNPAQFEPGEDLARYPRTFEADLAACAAEGVSAVYAPAAASMYHDQHSTWVVENELCESLEGVSRPGHFRGVLTVVLKLMHVLEPDVVVFGQKDAQQALAIRRMIRDLDLPVSLVVAPTVRESDGLALSSRNAYLDAGARKSAPVLHRAISACIERLREGEIEPARVRQAGLECLQAEPSVTIDYLEVVDLETMQVPDQVERPLLVAAAVRIGRTRLIDNAVHPADALIGYGAEKSA